MDWREILTAPQETIARRGRIKWGKLRILRPAGRQIKEGAINFLGVSIGGYFLECFRKGGLLFLQYFHEWGSFYQCSS